MATWPSGTKAGTTNLDAGTDSPRLARPDILQNVNNVNSIIDMFNIDSPSANQVLKYNTGNTRFELGSDTGSNGFTIIGDDSAGVNIADAGTLYLQGQNNITTSTNSDGTLTITGPTLTSYLTASSSATLTNKAGNISQWTNDSGYITSDLSFIGSTITAPSNADFTLTTSGTGTLDLDDTVRFNKNYKEDINTLTSSSTITVDCTLAPVHTVTLAVNTEFNITNLPTGGSVTIIITQDGTGSRTASWGTSGSTAVKFPGGAPTLTTTAAGIDVATVFNDGTNYLGNIALALA